MASPGYMKMMNSQGQQINSDVSVEGREKTAEVYALDHEVYIPTDAHTGNLTGTRKHEPFTIVKRFCPATPILYKACCSGETWQQVMLSWYRVDDQGKEKEYFRQTLTNVKVVSVKPVVHDVKDKSKEHYGHLEQVKFRYEKIEWAYLDGNIASNDEWNRRA